MHIAQWIDGFFGDFVKHMRPIPKIKWKRLPGLKLQAYTDDIQPRGYEVGLRETDIDPIQDWCGETQCGRRTSFNTFEFTSEKHITMFLLKWTS
jgi:hypothetical protein